MHTYAWKHTQSCKHTHISTHRPCMKPWILDAEDYNIDHNQSLQRLLTYTPRNGYIRPCERPFKSCPWTTALIVITPGWVFITIVT